MFQGLQSGHRGVRDGAAFSLWMNLAVGITHRTNAWPSGAPRWSLSGSGSPYGVNSSEMELIQYRSPVGGGPSGKTCPW